MDKISWAFRVKDDSEIVSDECVGTRPTLTAAGHVNAVVIMAPPLRVILGSSTVTPRYIHTQNEDTLWHSSGVPMLRATRLAVAQRRKRARCPSSGEQRN